MQTKKILSSSFLSILPLLLVGACSRDNDRDSSDPITPPPAPLELFKAEPVAAINLLTPNLIGRCAELFSGYNQDSGRAIAFEYFGPKGEKRPFKSTLVFDQGLCVSSTDKISIYLKSKEEVPVYFNLILALQADNSMKLEYDSHSCDPVEVLKFEAEILKEYKGALPFDTLQLFQFANDQICSRYKNAVRQSLMDVSKELR